MRVYCEEPEKEGAENIFYDWFNAGEDIDDFIFFDVKESISER